MSELERNLIKIINKFKHTMYVRLIRKAYRERKSLGKSER